jgi:hypothetical protein
MVNSSYYKGGDGACPLPLPTPAPCDIVVLPVQRVIAIGGFKSVGGKPNARPPETLESGLKRVVDP